MVVVLPVDRHPFSTAKRDHRRARKRILRVNFVSTGPAYSSPFALIVKSVCVFATNILQVTMPRIWWVQSLIPVMNTLISSAGCFRPIVWNVSLPLRFY